jgi:hypothetical protein
MIDVMESDKRQGVTADAAAVAGDEHLKLVDLVEMRKDPSIGRLLGQ